MKQNPDIQTLPVLWTEGAEAMEGAGAENGSGAVPSSFPNPRSYLWKTYYNINPESLGYVGRIGRLSLHLITGLLLKMSDFLKWISFIGQWMLNVVSHTPLSGILFFIEILFLNFLDETKGLSV